jgi:Flp pilus assembly protein TadD
VTAPAPALSPEQELLRQGIAQVRAGQTVAGMATLQKVIQRAPEEGAAWLWLGWAAARQNQRVLAERCFVRAQELGLGEPAEQALAWLRGS